MYQALKFYVIFVSSDTMTDTSVKQTNQGISPAHRRCFQQFFTALFPSAPTDPIPTMVSNLLPTLSESDREMLSSLIRIEELNAVVPGLRSGSSPGPDGLPNTFYTTFWPLLRRYLFHVVADISTHDNSYVINIPKPNAKPSDPTTWRAITLSNSDYKVVMSILTRRLNIVRPSIIHEAQACGFPGRSMYTALSGLRDALHYAHQRDSKGVVLSLDQAKAFDKVDHGYLFSLLNVYGFPDGFVDWVKCAYHIQNSTLLFGADLGCSFPIKRGVRQGCPLSPLLFVITLDPYIRMIHAARELRGIQLPGQIALKVIA